MSHSSSSETDDLDETFDDWISDTSPQESQSLFDETVKFKTVAETLAYDDQTFAYNLSKEAERLGLDVYGRMRLINKIRKDKITAVQALAYKSSEPFLNSDEYLVPALADDPLLQFQFDDTWSDEEEDNDQPVTDLKEAQRRIASLERKLKSAKQDLRDFRTFVGDKMNVAVENVRDDDIKAGTKPRDDDTHYFSSYAENDIHATMIQDKVRTSSYASYILTSPALFLDAVVLDVGCGTGILSLFAARAGARKVIAVDASDIASKAEEIVKANHLESVITVVRGKVENITLPEGIEKVDIIISEWMGYALLYESMLDSVLHARDRFLKPEGVMAPTQTRMMLALSDGIDLLKDRVGFWQDVYGFDLSAMGESLYDEAIVDVVSAESLISEPVCIKNLDLGKINAKELSFKSSFSLICTASRSTKCHAIVLYFDTFFSTTSDLLSPSEHEVKIIAEGDAVLAEMWPVGGRAAPLRRPSGMRSKSGEPQKVDTSAKVSSFSTGPLSMPTHWKQTIFFLQAPINAQNGSIVQGEFYCRKAEGNSRELEVEIHYTVADHANDSPSKTFIQVYDVR